MKSKPLCPDCKYFVRAKFTDVEDQLEYAKCSKHIDVVSGLPDHFCSRERTSGWLGCRLDSLCGQEGRFFELKAPQQ